MKESPQTIHYAAGILLAIAVSIMGYNAYTLQTIGQERTITIADSQSLLAGIVPQGTPAIYGAELQVRFDDVSAEDPPLADATIRKLGAIDRTIELTGGELERYINILYRMENGISCEYCCGARSIIFEDGKPACGCAHSYAMRGLAKYLITKHGDEYTDAQIMEEVAKWKTLFFPTQLQQKADILVAQGVEDNYINVASNKYRGIEQGASGGGMVGGC
ncbi:MAG: hypothetical protein ABIH41_05025 [Nanoarchaeota archaeon]